MHIDIFSLILLIQINVVVGNVVNAVCYSQSSVALCQY